MNTAALRLRLLLIAAPVAHGCSGSPAASTPSTTVSMPVAPGRAAVSTEVPYTPLRPTTPASARPAAGPAFWFVNDTFCVGAERTFIRESPAEDNSADFGCGVSPDAEAYADFCTTGDVCRDDVRPVFIFSSEGTERARGERRDTCCYQVLQAIRGRPFVVEASEREASLVRDLGGWSA